MVEEWAFEMYTSAVSRVSKIYSILNLNIF